MIFTVVEQQERVVEREVSWGIMKLRVDGGCVIDGDEALALAAGAERAGVFSWCNQLFLRM